MCIGRGRQVVTRTTGRSGAEVFYFTAISVDDQEREVHLPPNKYRVRSLGISTLSLSLSLLLLLIVLAVYWENYQR